MKLPNPPYCRDLFGAVVFFIFAQTLCLAAETSPSRTAELTPTSAQIVGSIKKEKFNLGPWEDETGYAQAVRVGDTLYVSGSVGSGAMPDAIKRAYDTVALTLAAHKLGFQHVVKENVYTTDIEALKANEAIRKKYYGADFPAATWVQVSRLFQPDYVIEVEVVAVFPK